MVCVFFNDTATTEIYTLSYTTLFRSPTQIACHLLGGQDPGLATARRLARSRPRCALRIPVRPVAAVHCAQGDRKSTRLNSSHANISYAVFCLKKKNIFFASCLLLSYP